MRWVGDVMFWSAQVNGCTCVVVRVPLCCSQGRKSEPFWRIRLARPIATNCCVFVLSGPGGLRCLYSPGRRVTKQKLSSGVLSRPLFCIGRKYVIIQVIPPRPYTHPFFDPLEGQNGAIEHQNTTHWFTTLTSHHARLTDELTVYLPLFFSLSVSLRLYDIAGTCYAPRWPEHAHPTTKKKNRKHSAPTRKRSASTPPRTRPPSKRSASEPSSPPNQHPHQPPPPPQHQQPR